LRQWLRALVQSVVLAILVQLSALIAACRFVSNAISDPLYAALKMANTKARIKKVKEREHVAPALVRSANIVIVKVGLVLTAAFVALAIGMTFYYRTIISWLFF
jgi:hypothetical protein